MKLEPERSSDQPENQIRQFRIKIYFISMSIFL